MTQHTREIGRGKHNIASEKEGESKMRTAWASGPVSTVKSSHSWSSQTFLPCNKLKPNTSTATQRVERGLVAASALKLGWEPGRWISCSLCRWCTSLN